MFLAVEDYESARAILEGMLTQLPDKPQRQAQLNRLEPTVLLGVLSRGAKDAVGIHRAAEGVNKVSLVAPEMDGIELFAQYFHAYEHLFRGDLDKAEVECRKTLDERKWRYGAKATRYRDDLLLLAQILSKQGRLKEALSAIEEARVISDDAHGKDGLRRLPTLRCQAEICKRCGKETEFAEIKKEIARLEQKRDECRRVLKRE
jgi:tetratricopeptide (TPR) repeat protein